MPEPEQTTPPAAPPRKPWPIKWIVYAILIYAFLNVLYLFLSN
jgi:hypothetical protein